MPRYEIYSFTKCRGLFGEYTRPLGYHKETFDIEDEAREYVRLMSKQDDRTVYRIKKIEEGWLTN